MEENKKNQRERKSINLLKEDLINEYYAFKESLIKETIKLTDVINSIIIPPLKVNLLIVYTRRIKNTVTLLEDVIKDLDGYSTKTINEHNNILSRIQKIDNVILESICATHILPEVIEKLVWQDLD